MLSKYIYRNTEGINVTHVCPLTGAGAYADNESGAVSTTGHGESITKVCLARQVTHHMESGKPKALYA